MAGLPGVEGDQVNHVELFYLSMDCIIVTSFAMMLLDQL